MAITVKYLEELGVDKEVAEKIFAERSKEIEADKVKREKLENELKEKTESLETVSKEVEALKTSNASAEDWKAKFEALEADNIAKAKQAEADRLAKEKADNILSRFNAVKKEFKHNDIEQAYLKRFGDALANKDFEGKSDADIYHELTKNDDCHKGVTAIKLEGGKPQGVGSKTYNSKEEIMSIKDSNERLKAIQTNPNLFRKE